MRGNIDQVLQNLHERSEGNFKQTEMDKIYRITAISNLIRYLSFATFTGKLKSQLSECSEN